MPQRLLFLFFCFCGVWVFVFLLLVGHTTDSHTITISQWGRSTSTALPDSADSTRRPPTRVTIILSSSLGCGCGFHHCLIHHHSHLCSFTSQSKTPANFKQTNEKQKTVWRLYPFLHRSPFHSIPGNRHTFVDSIDCLHLTNLGLPLPLFVSTCHPPSIHHDRLSALHRRLWSW